MSQTILILLYRNWTSVVNDYDFEVARLQTNSNLKTSDFSHGAKFWISEL